MQERRRHATSEPKNIRIVWRRREMCKRAPITLAVQPRADGSIHTARDIALTDIPSRATRVRVKVDRTPKQSAGLQTRHMLYEAVAYHRIWFVSYVDHAGLRATNNDG